MEAKLTKVTQDMEALGNKKRSYLDWIEFTTKVNYTSRIVFSDAFLHFLSC